ncbi:ion transport protein [Chloropicon primus]|uniref:Ion transport protein n=1 Tax=Chloropicon primus TaxID=1764295 RepID=A0A5B8MMW2_9CHLO|nr:ion transport protein [Chloropicon primus]|eukprot:QDZ21799.1 ion transport protein [Chloropicon primus]
MADTEGGVDQKEQQQDGGNDPVNVAMNPIAEEEEEARRNSGFIVQDNPLAGNSAAEAENKVLPAKKVTISVPLQDESGGFSSKLAARESALSAQLGMPYDEGASVLCRAVKEMKSGTGPVFKEMEDLHNEIARALGKPVSETPAERKATARWKELGGAVIVQNKQATLMQQIKEARLWEPKEGTIGHRVFKIVRHPKFQYVMTTNIIVTGIVHGLVATSWARDDWYFEMTLYIMDILLVIMSTVEFLALSFTLSWRCLLDGWNCLDFFTLAVSWLVIFLGNPYWSFGVCRTFRLTRQFESSKILVEGFIMALPSILWVFLIIFINICVFTVIGVQFFREKSPEQYGDIRTGLYTSFKLMTLENWTDEAETLRQAYKYGSAYFILFITTNSFILLNLLIATVVDLIREIGQKKNAMKDRKQEEKRRKQTAVGVSNKIANPFFKGLLPQHAKRTLSGNNSAPTANPITNKNVKDFLTPKKKDSNDGECELSVVSALASQTQKSERSSLALL